MKISEINKKTLVILQAFPDAVLKDIEYQCSKYWLEKAANISMPESIINVDLLYSLSRNFDFIFDSDFRDIIASDLSSKYKASFRDVQDLIEITLMCFSKFGITKKSDEKNTNFLLSFVCEIITNQSHSDLPLSLGIGPNFIDKVIELISGSDVEVSFLNEIEQSIMNKIDYVREKCGNTTWKIELLGLNCKFSTPENIDLSTVFESDSCEILDVCCYLGSNDGLNKKRLEKYVNQTSKIPPDILISYLTKIGAIFTNKTGDSSERVFLSPFGFRLASTYFAEKSIEKLDISEFSFLPASWQVAIINRDGSYRIIKDIIVSNTSISPSTIEAIANRIESEKYSGLNSEFIHFLEKKLQGSANFELRKKCLETISKIAPSHLSNEYVNKLFKADQSDSVQNSAIEILLRQSSL